MQTILKIEEAALFLLCIFLFNHLPFAWWWFPALLFLPDIGMIGYLANPEIGAMTYNVFHFRFVAAAVGIVAMATGNDYAKLAAILLFVHISMDRMMGYGLKYFDGFHHTHLGTMGKK